jgi:hypothetical protein
MPMISRIEFFSRAWCLTQSDMGVSSLGRL